MRGRRKRPRVSVVCGAFDHRSTRISTPGWCNPFIWSLRCSDGRVLIRRGRTFNKGKQRELRATREGRALLWWQAVG